MNNNFGGDWTSQKIEIVISYTQAYLTVMKNQPFKLIYFDGFAGSGEIEKKEAIIQGAALRILAIDEPKPFNLYYFVELEKKYADNLETLIKSRYPQRKFIVKSEDCNVKIKDMADYLRKPANKFTRVLAFIDPKGMQVKWESLEILKDLGIDMWILVPLGMGVTRLLKKDGNIDDTWVARLQIFLGISESEIRSYFYASDTLNLFGELEGGKRLNNTILKAAKLYRERLNTIFKYVSQPFVMRNSKNSPMYHFYLATNNTTAIKIANDVIKPKFK
ncbi:three-Cys-motif partner protein [Mucilaginibacter frigoritolerans]|uniref:Three-Cys-motif partner protein n=1 Tax=Mucilaginibacter frigoritolerans TaxID=652788 RepID=A0A562TVA9_9SPHI|nr:three-Cys-motif partner protein TcmP [Mucilaginibacter frigoritolerans]TWI97549.1 three-Cys-motif partner protein [Mucilaginibacter frigoritolerans]